MCPPWRTRRSWAWLSPSCYGTATSIWQRTGVTASASSLHPPRAAVQSTCGYPAAVTPTSMMRDSTAGGGSDEPWFRRVRGGAQADPERRAGFRGGGGPGDLAAVHLDPDQRR